MGRLHNIAVMIAALSMSLSFALSFLYGWITTPLLRNLRFEIWQIDGYNFVMDASAQATARYTWMFDLAMLLTYPAIIAVIIAAATIRLKPRAYCIQCGVKLD